MHPDRPRDFQHVVQLLCDIHGTHFGFDNGNAAELGSCAADQPSRQRLWVQAVFLEKRLFLQKTPRALGNKKAHCWMLRMHCLNCGWISNLQTQQHADSEIRRSEISDVDAAGLVGTNPSTGEMMQCIVSPESQACMG